MRLLLRLLLIGLIVLLAIQVVPYGRTHNNPRTVQEVRWDSEQTRSLAQDACLDCHSNLTEWPWYTSVAPVSWLTTRDVKEGRAKLNFSEWQRAQDVDLQEVLDAIRQQDMPPLQYRAIHSAARLDDTQRQQLADGLTKTWKADPPG